MRFELKEVSICAEKEFELIRITDPVREFVAQTGVKNGVVYVITEHTTTGIMVNESLPCVEKDIMETLDRIAPENYPYHHNHYLPTYGTIGVKVWNFKGEVVESRRGANTYSTGA